MALQLGVQALLQEDIGTECMMWSAVGGSVSAMDPVSQAVGVQDNF